jgi:predicted MPP superfamily phosphohydrolase
LQLSDLHASWVVPQTLIDAAFEAAVSEAPDLICLTGDFITFRTDFDRRALVSAVNRLVTFRRTFAVVGNHDGGSWAKQHRGNPDHAVVDRILEEAGVTLLP